MKPIRLQINLQKGRTVEMTLAANAGSAKQDGVQATLTETVCSGCRLIRLQLQIDGEPLGEPNGLAMEAPVRAYLPPEELPQKITAMYLYNPWWTRPAFVEGPADIPARTQAAFFKYPDRCACLVPMVGDCFKTTLTGGTETALCLEMTAGLGGQNSLDEPLCLYAEGPTTAEAVHTVFCCLAGLKGVRLREARRLPEMFRYLGWCSWDAFRTEVNETGIRQKAAELREKQVPVKWMLIDDGWFPADGRTIRDFSPDKAKFPRGFEEMIREIRRTGGVRWFGVWHALAGYWDGVSPESALAVREAGRLYRTMSGWLVPSPETGARFYDDWYQVLAREGIDFVKVDGQSSAPFYFKNGLPLSKAVRDLGEALENSASRMDGAVINCMGMAMESILARPVSAISRNSDDFVPEKEGSFTEHLLQNAYNAIYHNELYCCDWDMFWTRHPDAVKHGLLRAISGGPVYFSDKVGDTLPDVLRPLTCPDGRLLMMPRSARPTEDCIYSDPTRSGVLKLHNAAPWGGDKTAGGIAVYNLTGQRQDFAFSPADIPDLDCCEQYWVYDFFGKKARVLARDEAWQGAMEPGGFGWYLILPKTGPAACLGLLEKYVGVAAVESVRESENTSITLLRAAGRVGWLADRAPRQVWADGVDVTALLTGKDGLWELPLPETDKTTLLGIAWQPGV